MNFILELYIVLPLVTLLINGLVYFKQNKVSAVNYEKIISTLAFATLSLQLFLAVVATVKWALLGFIAQEFHWFNFLQTEHNLLSSSLLFDRTSAVFLLLGTLLIFMIVRYSSYYMHREDGFSRFFNLLLFFDFGYSVVVLAGNFGILFLGWEFIGISSFLLIAFYRERYLPVRNAVKIFALYRIGDISILLVIWASHYLWDEHFSFAFLAHNPEQISASITANPVLFRVLAFALIMAAAIKSAQLPFSTWLARAMEGPTPSSAIFYGSLAVHLGAFILLRTAFLWQQLAFLQITIVLIGATTSIVATLISRVQSAVKSQIAYSSIAQIGVIFIEIACGLHLLALIHIVGNACLRTYQLLVSPSIVSYLIREQAYNYQPITQPANRLAFINKIKLSTYLLCVREFYLEALIDQIFWRPIKNCGKFFSFIGFKVIMFVLVPIYAAGAWCYFKPDLLPKSILHYLPLLFCGFGAVLVVKAFVERRNPYLAWTMLIMNHFWVALAILFNSNISAFELLIYLNGVTLAGALGFWCLYSLHQKEGSIECYQYLGHVYEHDKLSLVFLIAALGLNSFPLTTTFIGEDIILSYVSINQFSLIMLIAFGFIVSGISSIRLYARLFLGPHIKSYHSIANRSA